MVQLVWFILLIQAILPFVSGKQDSSNDKSSLNTTAMPSQIPNYQSLIAKGSPWTWIWQYTGRPLAKSADIHVLDGFDHSLEDFQFVRKKGSFPVAYFSCSYEAWRPDATLWKDSDKGKKMDGWDELWPSASAIRNHDSNLWSIYKRRLDHFLANMASITTEPNTFAIEWDNVDLYDSIHLGKKEGLRFLRRLQQITEDRGLVFVLKNCVDVIDQLPGVQMYVNEQGQQYKEIDRYAKVGRRVPVLNVEYRNPKAFPSYVYTIYYPNKEKIDGNAITFDKSSQPKPTGSHTTPISNDGLNYQSLIAKGSPWTWIWQYTGHPLDKSADIHVLDGFDHSAKDFQSVRDKGSFPVAYFSCSYESWRPDATLWKDSDKGKKLDGWDELWPSASAIRNHDSNLWSIYNRRMDQFLAKTASITTEHNTFAIEWDNVDLYDSIHLGKKEGLRFLRRLKQITEDRGLVFVLKNCVDVIDQLPGVQMYVNEQGQQYKEIDRYAKVGRIVPVLNVEYRKPKAFPDYVYTIYYSNKEKIDGNAITFDESM